MAKVINVKDLTTEQVAALEKLVGLFKRQAAGENKEAGAKGAEEFALGTRRSNVIGGRVSRRHNYQDPQSS